MLAHLTRLFYLFSVLSIARAVLVNVTVDDASPDPLTGKTIAYLPTASWQQGDSCTTCNAGADGRLMNGGTWHDGTYFPAGASLSPSGPLNATFVFNGTAIYVFCALALQTTNALAAFSNMTFYIDGDLVGQFQRIPPGTNGFQYNVSVYSNTTLSPGSHTFMLQNGVAVGNGGDTSLTLFDYLVYSYDNGLDSSPTTSSVSSAFSTSTPTTGSSHKTAIVVGSVVGPVAGLVIVAFMIWFLLRCRKTKSIRIQPDTKQHFEPFTGQRTLAPTFGSTVGGDSALNLSSNTYLATPNMGYSVGAGKHSRSQERTGTYGPASHAPSSSTDLSSTSYPLPSPPWQEREQDAGPISATYPNPQVGPLPPDYRQVFTQSNELDGARIPVQSSVSEKRNI